MTFQQKEGEGVLARKPHDQGSPRRPLPAPAREPRPGVKDWAPKGVGQGGWKARRSRCPPWFFWWLPPPTVVRASLLKDPCPVLAQAQPLTPAVPTPHHASGNRKGSVGLGSGGVGAGSEKQSTSKQRAGRVGRRGVCGLERHPSSQMGTLSLTCTPLQAGAQELVFALLSQIFNLCKGKKTVTSQECIPAHTRWP